MPAQFPNLDRFVRAVHRRHVLLRGLERTAIGFLAGCGMAIALTPLLVWRDRPPATPAIAAILLGMFVGFLWAVTSRPTVLAAATEADRQLELSDLLLSALTAQTSRDPWSTTVLAMADARCRSLRPRQVVLNRFGARAWGGVGLCGAMVLSLLLLTGSLGETRARAVAAIDPNAGPANSDGAERKPEPPLLPAAPAVTWRPTPAGRDNDADRPGPAGMPASEKTDPAVGAKPELADANDNSGQPTAGDAGGVSVGTAESRVNQPPPRPSDAAGVPVSPSTAQPQGDQPGTGGAGRAKPPAGPADRGVSGTTASPAEQQKATPPWQSSGWGNDVRRANEAVDSGQVPSDYRDIVRDYFDRR